MNTLQRLRRFRAEVNKELAYAREVVEQYEDIVDDLDERIFRYLDKKLDDVDKADNQPEVPRALTL